MRQNFIRVHKYHDDTTWRTLVGKNLLVNDGNFGSDGNSDGLGDGWSVLNGLASKSISGNVQVFTASVTQGGIGHALTTVVGNVYYVCALSKGTSAYTCTLRLQGATAYATVNANIATTYTFVSIYGTADSTSTQIYFFDRRASAWDAVSVQKIAVFNLTALFGGSVPTQATLDARMGCQRRYINRRFL